VCTHKEKGNKHDRSIHCMVLWFWFCFGVFCVVVNNNNSTCTFDAGNQSIHPISSVAERRPQQAPAQRADLLRALVGAERGHHVGVLPQNGQP
jgi:hypothetical protein